MGERYHYHHAEEGQVRDRETYALIDRSIEALGAELAVGKSQRLEEYLAFTARFHRYSLFNQILIHSQKSDATRVAGYRTWQKFGYQVAKGEKGIRIFAPRPYKRPDPETGDEEERITFTTVSVFDASQLVDIDTRPLPEYFMPLDDNQREFYRRLALTVAADGITLRESTDTRGAQGYSAHGEIVLKHGLDSTSKALVLLHEYAHELLHWDKERLGLDLKVKECHAEAVSYVVARHFGIHNPFSADYLSAWGHTHESLKQELEIVRLAAGQIIERIHAFGSGGGQTHDPDDL
jgi:hypothetical protein